MSYVVNENNQNKNLEYAKMMCVVLRFVQVFSMIYSLLSFCYWALLMLDISVPIFIRFFFEMPYIFVRLLGYVPKGTSADFSGAIIGTVFLVIVFLSSYVAENMERKIAAETKRQKRRPVNRNISSSYHSSSTISSSVNATAASALQTSSEIELIDLSKKKFIFLLEVKISEVDISAKSMHSDSEKLKKRICDAIIDNLNMNKLDQCGFYKKNLFIVYKDFEYIDSFIYYIKVTLDSLAKEFATPQLMIDFNITFSVISNLSQLESELMIMDMILTLNMMNEFISTAKFKTAYENREHSKYVLVTKGTYNLSRNLSVNNNQDLFSIRERRL